MLTALSVKIIHDLLASFCYNQLIMTLKTFFNFTRIQTLPAALLSPIAGCLFAFWYFGSFHFWPTLLFFIGLASINLFVSAWNNLMDYQKALDPEYKKWNTIVAKSINPKLALNICLALLAIDVVVGLIVLSLTNLAILPIGGLCFLIAIFYTYGPFAFSRFPLGEILAGLCEGFFGFFLAVYINSYDKGYFFINFDRNWFMTWTWDFKILLPILLVGLMCFVQNFNIMFSDNICDLEQDIRNERYTLPYYLKIPLSLKVFTGLYLFAGLCILIAIALGILPIWSLLMSVIALKVIPNIKKFRAKQSKSETFHLQIDNLMLFNASLALTLLLGIIFK
ncbi:putative prenyltransferase contains 14-dihydroxy-2-naphthoate octaprenyltransferase domain [Lactococcus lactis subsp. lactis]|uniref:Putative prenyltransferase contains 14-dihydroxy-2-naphthoate octaprenyltransferase domain n=2 Tax=Lactococcus lactis TaxID=1358 RepID=A0A0V8E108_LACLL|nr:putative prenyltransferase contains 14-dihydroxy-2-naphthoate octaprenyltransferase domain [Lactococcus lactis subsp. lactis]